MPVKKGDKLVVEYEGRFDDGTVFDSTLKQGKPLEFEVGSGKVIPGFENALVGMEPGGEKEVKLPPKDAYGDRDPQLVRKIPRKMLPQDVKAGQMYLMGMSDGFQMPVTVAEVNAEEILLDLNHPLAGKNLNFKIKLLSISSPQSP